VTTDLPASGATGPDEPAAGGHPLGDAVAYRHVVFDWNGTVIDDVALAVRSVNRLRTASGLGAVDTDTYRRLFRFPIAEFYRDLGFDLEATDFAELMTAYLRHFDAEVHACPLHTGFVPLAEDLRRRGVTVAVLSASHQDTLARTARRLGIDHLIDHLIGLEDSAAAGKLERARLLDGRLRPGGDDAVMMIGDTDHDRAVADDRGWDFVAVSTGHQSRDRLNGLGAPVLDGLGEVLALLSRPGPAADGATQDGGVRRP